MRRQIFNDAVLSKADGTTIAYLYKCRQFFVWIREVYTNIKLPVQEEIIAAYLVHLKNKTKSENVLTSAAAAIKWLHTLVNAKINPADSPLVQQILISARRQLHKPPIQKEPMTLDQVKRIVDQLGGADNTLLELRTACYVSLKFALLFRHDEMVQIKASHIEELPNNKGFSIFIPRSKTDIFREGNKAYLSNTHNSYSPVTILSNFMSRSSIRIGQDVYLFTALSYHPSTKTYKPLVNKPLSYTRCRELFVDALKLIGIQNPKMYGLHSLRSGGASHLANKGVDEELIMQHGRWKTTVAKNRYVKRDCDQRLLVSSILSNE